MRWFGEKLFTAFWVAFIHTKSMKELITPNPPTDFDLPTNLGAGPGYVPPKGRGAETELRQGKPYGWLVARMQRNGLAMLSYMLEAVEDPTSQAYLRNIGGMELLGSAWHTYAEQASHMRRRLKLPRLDLERAHPNRSAPLGTHRLTADAVDRLQGTTLACADSMVAAYRNGVAKPLDRRHIILGQELGNGSLRLIGADAGNLIADNPWLSDTDVQLMVRERSLGLLRDTRSVGHHLNATPTLAQLADPDSGFAVHTRREAPDAVFNAYADAVDLFATAA